MRRRLAIVAVVLAAAIGISQAVAASADAGSSTMCTGYSGCAAAGKSNFGYSGARSTSYWAMTPGHNCTNYVAYRLVEDGHALGRPWDGDGNAMAWGTSNADITNHTPEVGAVAWWAAHDNGAGSLGHVSYVERVVSSTRIVVSEDNFGGDFHWKIIDKKNGNWPTGFIHLKDESVSASFPALRARALDATVVTPDYGTAPVAASTIKPGSSAAVTMTFRNTGDSTWAGVRLVTSTPGLPLGATWSSPTSPTVQKQAAVITGAVATFTFFVTVPAGVPDGTPYRTDFSLVDSTGAAIAKSAETVTFTADSRDPFPNRPPLGIVGSARQGSTLTAISGVSGTVAPSLSYQWSRDGKPIAHATAASYRLTSGDVGHSISVAALAQAPGYLPLTQSASWGTTIRSIYPSTLALKGRLKHDAQLVSANGTFKLVNGSNGALALVNRFTKKKVWSSHVTTKKSYTRLRGDGKLVTYSKSGHAVWKSPNTKKAVRAVVTNSGKLVLYTKSGATAWKTK